MTETKWSLHPHRVPHAWCRLAGEAYRSDSLPGTCRDEGSGAHTDNCQKCRLYVYKVLFPLNIPFIRAVYPSLSGRLDVFLSLVDA